MKNNDSVFALLTHNELAGAIDLARKLTRFENQCKELGPFSLVNGKWAVTTGICFSCKTPTQTEIFDSYTVASGKAEEIIREIIKSGDPFYLYTGSGNCPVCKERDEEAKKLRKRCSGCAGDCSYCGTHRALEALYD